MYYGRMNAYTKRLSESSKAVSTDVPVASPVFAAVELLAQPAPSSASALATGAVSSDVSISVRLPNGVEAQLTGLDSDSATLLVLEVMKETMKSFTSSSTSGSTQVSCSQ